MSIVRILGRFRSAGMALAVVLAVVAETGCAPAQEARLTRVVIDSVESPAFGGQVFGEVGQYEILRGRVFGEVAPEHPGNTGIVYIESAPRNARGNVEYDVDLAIVKPIDMERGNQTLFYGVTNRGRQPFSLGGDGLLMRRGFTLVWSGWHADVASREGRDPGQVAGGDERRRQPHPQIDPERVPDRWGRSRRPARVYGVRRQSHPGRLLSRR